jgi:Type VI secretion system (T6SS), amidase effector protein 4
MESFVDAHSRRPIKRLEVGEGDTKIVGLKKFSSGNAQGVKVVINDTAVAFCNQVVHLNDRTKHKYRDFDPNFTDDFHWRHMSSFINECAAAEQHNLFFFQICGKAAGRTELVAKFTTGRNANPLYADTVSIVVKENKKRLTLKSDKGPAPTFRVLWENHPLNPANGPVHYPCNDSGDKTTLTPKSSLGTMQCMVRFCTALEKSGVTLAGLHGSQCNMRGTEHAHHFSNPYDFESWQKSENSHYTWEAKPPLQSEPMPGIAASQFMYKRHGIVLFWNYFDIKGRSSMFGGHIDLWNEARMGNTYSMSNPWEGQSAFYRARKITFWPLD